MENDQKVSFRAQNGQQLPLKLAEMTIILTQNRKFLSHLLTFWAENKPKSEPFELKKNTLTTTKQL